MIALPVESDRHRISLLSGYGFISRIERYYDLRRTLVFGCEENGIRSRHAGLREKPLGIIPPRQILQIDTQLLALLVKMAPLQA